MRRTGTRRALALLATIGWIGAWAGCVTLKTDGTATPDGRSDTGIDEARADVALDADAPAAGILWPNDVPVCWYSPLDEVAFESPLDSQTHWIHDTVESNWGKEANLRFGGWPLCSMSGKAANAELLIVGADAGDPDPSFALWGGQVDGGIGTETQSSLVQPPNITFLPLTTDADVSVVGPRELAFCAANRIFSRVLGLEDDLSAQPLGAMTCGDVYDPAGSRLSALQILRVRRAYGPKPAGSVVAFDGRCLTAASASSDSLVWTDDCVPQESGVASPDQRWQFNPWAGSLGLVESGLALDSLGATVAQQADVVTADAGSAQQMWTTSAAALRGIGGTCLDFGTPDGGGSGTVALQPCGRSIATQRVDFGPDASIRATSTGGATCLAVTDDAKVAPAPCDGTTSQQWALAPGGAVHSLAVSGGCMAATVDDEDPEVGLEDGLALEVAACSGSIAQEFDVFGVLQTPSQEGGSPMCLDVAGYGRADHTPIQSWTCDVNNGIVGNENDWWDITW
jgi:hypothetical protein